MLNVMRDNLRHLKWVLLIVAASMLLYLGAFLDPRSRRGATADWAAKVDGEQIPSDEFLRAARQQDDYYRRLLGQQYDTVKKNIKVGSQAIQSLVDRKIMLAEAKAMGLSATKDEISREIVDSPNFRDASGHFVGKERYTEYIEQSFDGGVPAFEQQLADDIVARKWLGVMTASATVTDADVEKAWRDKNVRAAYDYVVVPVSAVNFEAAVSPAEVAAWYDAHKDDYKRPESRKIKFIVIDRASLLGKVKLTDEEVRADYDAHMAEYQHPEQRHARHILFKLPAGAGDADKRSVHDLAASVLARAQKGEDFATLARTMSADTASAAKGGDLGWFGKGQMVKPFDDAVFSTPPGQFAPVVETPYGFHVIQVLEERPAGAVPFDEVKDGIRKRLELQRAQDLAVAEGRRLRGEIKTAADLDSVAAKEHLKVEERVVSADDRAGDLGPSPEFWAALSALPAGEVTDPVGIARGLAVVACTAVLPPSVPPLAEVTERVKTDVLNARGRAAALAAARRIVAAPSLEAGAKALKLETKKSGDVAPGAPVPGAGISPELDHALFDPRTIVGATGAVETPGGAVAYVVTRHDAFDAARFAMDKASLREQLLKQRRDEMMQGIVESLRQKHAVEVNQAMVDSVNG
jgi:peptidyl-prolyl cis-trans isomerase D